MKKVILSCIFFFAIISTGQAQSVFDVNTGFIIDGANYGYKFDNLMPYVGLQYFNAGITVSYESYYFENELVKETNVHEISASVFMPNIGLKYFMPYNDKLNPYLNLVIYKPFFSTSSKENGQDIEEFNKLTDETSIFGTELSFGVEYNLSKNFAIGGEFGFRLMFGSSKIEYQNRIYDYNNYEYYDVTETDEFDMNLGMTFTRFSLNYYFD